MNFDLETLIEITKSAGVANHAHNGLNANNHDKYHAHNSLNANNHDKYHAHKGLNANNYDKYHAHNVLNANNNLFYFFSRSGTISEKF